MQHNVAIALHICVHGLDDPARRHYGAYAWYEEMVS